MAQWFLESLDISGGFLADLCLRLPRGLICVIGPRGSGKSTLAEAIRLGIGGLPSGASKSRLEFIKANLGTAVITVKTAPGVERAAYTIRRAYGQPASLATADGRPVSAIDLDRGTFLPLDAYSSLEIEAIADESLGTRRRSMLDELCPTEMQQIQLVLGEHRRALEANADAIQAVQRRIADLTEQIEEVGDAQARLEALPPMTAQQAAPEFQGAARQRQANEQEAGNVRRAVEGVVQLRADVRDAVARARLRIPAAAVAGSANAPILSPADRALAAMWDAVEEWLRAMDGAISLAEEDLRRVQADLALAHAAQEATYLRLQQENRVVAQAVEARGAAERQVAAVERLGTQRAQAVEEMRLLQERRKSLKAEYLLTRDQVSEQREEVAARLQQEAGRNVRVRVQRNTDTLEYRELLLSSLHGSKLKNQEDILAALTHIRPEQLAQVLTENDLEELEAHASFGKERGRKILDALRQQINPLTLEVLPIEDRVCIELNVAATDGEGNFKDAAELSRGQKCTALLPILLARRDTPLVIDQPEDNLDNHFIYETVVESILRLKARRQMVFITHNANIPVLGEADLVVVMNSDGRNGYVEKAGSIDVCRREIIDLLEGGEEAFALRRKRYGTR